MSRKAIVEEVEDSDLSDPSEGNISDFDETDIIRTVPSRPAHAQAQQSGARNPITDILMQQTDKQPFTQSTRPANFPSADAFKSSIMLYPLYFDKSRSRAQGRRVSSKLAVSNPLARTIAEACSALRLYPMLEAYKTHPSDWANPGRVRVIIPEAAVRAGFPTIENKHHLMALVAQVLKEMPTTEDCEELRDVPRELPLGAPKKDEPWPRVAVPRGWRVNELVPLASKGLGGGGVSEEMFGKVMREMAGGGNPMAALMGGQ